MFARRIAIQLKPNSAAEFTRIMDEEGLPLLREAKGFRDEVLLLSEDGLNAVDISFWNSKQEAESFDQYTYPAMLRLFKNISKGSPVVHSYIVAALTKQVSPHLQPAVVRSF